MRTRYYPCGLERLFILDLHCRLGLYIWSSRNHAKGEFKKRDKAKSTKKKQTIPKTNQSIYMRRLGNELLLPRVNLTFRLVAFELLALLIIQKLRAWAIAILSLLEKNVCF